MLKKGGEIMMARDNAFPRTHFFAASRVKWFFSSIFHVGFGTLTHVGSTGRAVEFGGEGWAAFSRSRTLWHAHAAFCIASTGHCLDSCPAR